MLLELILTAWFIVIASMLSGCASLRGTPPPIEVRLWSGDFTKGAIVRKQDKTQVKCDDPDFSDYVALTFEDFQKMTSTYMDGCEKWAEQKK